ncbi:MAG: DUF6586 family protein [Candidatus Reddybacter sp.]
MIYRRLFNQHLSSAQLLLTDLAGQINADLSRQRAFEHSALHLLNSAYLCQLRAIADNYHCPDIASISDIQSLQTALVAIDTPAPEAREIEVLASEGWLAELLKAQQQLCLPASSQIPEQVMPIASQSDIALHDDSRGESMLNVDKLQQWFLALEELVQRQGEMMTEY